MDNVAPDANSVGTPSAPAPAESSPATNQPIQIPHKDSPEYLEWRKTGEIPDPKAKPKSADSAPAKTKPQEESAPSSAEGEEPEETGPASEAGARQERRTGAQDRLQEILSDLKRAGLSPSELKSFRREAQQAAKLPETTVQPQPQPEPPKPLKKPALDDYKSWDEYDAARDAYDQQRVNQLVQQQFQQMLAYQAQQQANQQANDKLTAARQRYGEAATETISSTAQALFQDQQIHPVIKGIVNDSPVIADLLYVMGSKSGEFQEFLQLAKTNPGQALRQAVLLEQLVQEELRNGNGRKSDDGQEPAERDDNGRFISQRPPAKRNEAPPPAREVSGRASPPADESDAAFARSDFRAFRNAENRAEIARRKGQ